MKDQNNIQDELRNLNSSLPAEGSQPPFSVPEGYFDGLASQILAKVKAGPASAADEINELSPLLAGISREMPYSVPSSFFQQNLAGLPLLWKEENSLVLEAAGKALPYTVPTGYFENLPEVILSRVQPPKAKVVPLFARKWMRAAVAAVVGGVMLVGGYRLLNNPTSDQPQALVQTPADTASQRGLVARNEVPVTRMLEKVSTKELDEFIKSAPINPAKLNKPAPEKTPKTEVEELLKDVSPKEIDAFLEQLPTADDELLVID